MIRRWKRRGSHLATARLAVRPHLPWPRRVGAALLVCALLVGGVDAAYHYGVKLGRRDPAAVLQAKGAALQVSELRTALGEERQREASLTQQLRVETSTREALSHQLQQLQSDNNDLSARVAFYESLLTMSDRAPALSVSALHAELLTPTHYRIRALLVQGQSSQEPFKANIDFRLVIDQNGKRTEMVWPQTKLVVTVARFARVEKELDLPAGGHLREIEIRVYAQGDNHVRIARTFEVKG